MDIGRSFTYALEDKEWWQKILIGGLLTLIPIIGPFYGLGYLVAAIKNVIDGQDLPLPDALEDFGNKLVQGLIAFAIGFIYAIPAIILGSCAGIGSGVLGTVAEDADAVGAIVGGWAGCFGCITALYGIVIGLIYPFAIASYADTGQFGDAFKLGEIWAMLKGNIGPAFIVLLMSFVAGLLGSIVGMVLCFIGFFATMFFAQLIMAHLYGQLYLKARPATP